jgi:hypothetical protein
MRSRLVGQIFVAPHDLPRADIGEAPILEVTTERLVLGIVRL